MPYKISKRFERFRKKTYSEKKRKKSNFHFSVAVVLRGEHNWKPSARHPIRSVHVDIQRELHLQLLRVPPFQCRLQELRHICQQEDILLLQSRLAPHIKSGYSTKGPCKKSI